MKNIKYRLSKDRYESPLKERLRNLVDEGCSSTEEKAKRKNELAENIGVSKAALSNYLVGNNFPSTERLLKIADFFNCSLDYLIGLSDTRSPNAEIQSICEYTGLSEEAIEVLHLITLQVETAKHSETTITSERTLRFLNRALKRSHVSVDKANEGIDIPVLTVFTDLEEYVSANAVITFSTGGVDEAYDAKELYLEAKTHQLRKWLEFFMNDEGSDKER